MELPDWTSTGTKTARQYSKLTMLVGATPCWFHYNEMDYFSAFYHNRTELFISQFEAADNGNYTCSGQTSQGSADYTVLVSTDNILFPVTAPSNVITSQGHRVSTTSKRIVLTDRKCQSIVLLISFAVYALIVLATRPRKH